MYELIITEKPNAAKKIADALADGKAIKESKNKVPYYKVTHGNKDLIIACAVGHLYGLGENKTKKRTIPMFDIHWVPSSQLRKADFSKKYLAVIKSLSKDANEFTIATDYDIEGEVIGLNIVRFACKKKDAKRMKFSTLTKDDIVKAYENASSTLDWGQANAGETRHKLDWYYGINTSRALTRCMNKAGMFKLMSTGRVQGPALKIIVDKEKEISAFKPVPYWQIELDGNINNGNIVALHVKNKFWEKEEAEKVMETVKDEKTAKVNEVTKKEFKQSPPHPFDLTSMQVEAHKCVHISPKETLSIAQELYTKGYISYPRTSSQQLPPEIGFKKILNLLQKNDNYSKEAKTVLSSKLIPNNGKKTDPAHPALYPTGVMPSNLKDREARIYDLIVRRFLATFGNPAVRQTMSIIINCKDELFKTSGTTTLEPGWHTLYGKHVMLKDEELPSVNKDDTVDINKITRQDLETQPPKRYTESSIIKELEKRNLGTKATRAQIVDTLFQRGYVDGKSVKATELGVKTSDTLEKHCPKINDEELTKHFEEEMEMIRTHKMKTEKVLDEAKAVLSGIVQEFRSHEQEIGDELIESFIETRDELSHVGKCPKCKDGELHIRKGKFGQFIACNKYPDCKTTYSLPNGAMIKGTDKTCEQCNMPLVIVIKKAKRPQEVCINPDCPSKKNEEAEKEVNVEHKKCPQCGKPLVLRKSLYGEFIACSGYPKCRFIEGNKFQKKPAAAKKSKKKAKKKKTKKSKR